MLNGKKKLVVGSIGEVGNIIIKLDKIVLPFEKKKRILNDTFVIMCSFLFLANWLKDELPRNRLS